MRGDLVILNVGLDMDENAGVCVFLLFYFLFIETHVSF